jgi:hypothetical protein
MPQCSDGGTVAEQAFERCTLTWRAGFNCSCSALVGPFVILSYTNLS